MAKPLISCRVPVAWRASCAAANSVLAWLGPSLPLDIGYSETVPAGIRNAVMLRDNWCRWAGGCNQPAFGL